MQEEEEKNAVDRWNLVTDVKYKPWNHLGNQMSLVSTGRHVINYY